MMEEVRREAPSDALGQAHNRLGIVISPRTAVAMDAAVVRW